MFQKKKLIVIGGGAAGFFCAVNAARICPGLEVTILEKTGKVLQKVKISGGGRCNTTHALFDISPLTKKYPRGEKFLKRAFRHFYTKDTVEWFAQRNVRLVEEADGRMFPSTNESQTIIDCLLKEAEKYNVSILYHTKVSSFIPAGESWQVDLDNGTRKLADFVCVAAGGFPKSEQFNWLTQSTGHSIEPPVPSLFSFNLPGHEITGLMGISTQVQVKIAGTKFESNGPLIITHWGISGPAVLRTSAFAARWLAEKHYNFTVIINWLPKYNEQELRAFILTYRQQKGTQKVQNSDWADMPSRLWSFLMKEAGISADQKWAELSAGAQNKLIKCICAYEIQSRGKTTYKDEFVTAGGIALQEINPDTMESKLHPGLFFAGEIMDVDGITGGFNFQNAWTSGFLAAKSITNRIL